MSCGKCEKLPEMNFGISDVFVSLPTQHHRGVFEELMIQFNYAYKCVEGGFLIHQVLLDSFITVLCNHKFNFIEKEDIKILPLKLGEVLSYASLSNYRTLIEWENLFEGNEIASIIDQARIKTFFQPIIHAQTGDIYGYEALSRGILKDGSFMNPETLFSKAKSMNLLFYLDRICREASIRAASKQGLTKKLFINFIPTAIYKPELCLQSTESVLKEENIRPDQVVFEVVETEQVKDFEHLNQILDYYRNKGYSTALDDIGSGYSNIDALIKLKPNYMKIDMKIIRNIHLDTSKQETLDVFIQKANQIGVTILAEGVETLEEFLYLKSKNVDLMQGYYFGRPQASISEMLSETV